MAPHRLCNPNAHVTPKIRADLGWPLAGKPEHILKFAARDWLREAAEIAAGNARPAAPLACPVILRVVIAYEKGRQTLDFDNAVSSMKGAIDGIVRGGFMVDDKQVKGIYLDQIKDPDGRGYIDVTVEPVEEGPTS
jgi:hypothetical protein